MFKQAVPFFLHVRTPLHAGSGDDLGIVDLPIQRERHTDFPKVEGSSMKGAIREAFREYVDVKALQQEFPAVKEASEFLKALDLVFGPEDDDGANLHAGALGFTDARLLLFPIKSMRGVFAWISCPMVLETLQNDMQLTDPDWTLPLKDLKGKPLSFDGLNSNLSQLHDEGFCLLVKEQKENLTIEAKGKRKVVLEEYAFTMLDDTDAKAIAEKLEKLTGISELRKRLVILSNDDFRDFVTLSTEVITRIRIDPETGTVKEGALFTEEFLPAESVLYALALSTGILTKEKQNIFQTAGQQKEEERVMTFFRQGLPKVIQLGGDATIGKGLVRTILYQGEK